MSDATTVIAMGGGAVYLDGGLATAGLLATGAQTDVQNVPVDLLLVTPKLAETLIQKCWEVPTRGT